jgi:signal transduction histidine kinase
VNVAEALGNRWFDVYACRVGGSDSRNVAIVFNDITERRETAEALADLQRRRDESLTEKLLVANAEIAARRELLSRLAQVEDDERRAIHREMHDRIGQDLASAKLNIDLARSTATGAGLTRVRLEVARDLVQYAIDNSRNIMAELRPPGLDDHGLTVALEFYAEEVAKRLSISVAFHGLELEQRLPRLVETTLFRITQEAISNLAKHANARKVDISLYEEAREVRLMIADDGSGFDVTRLPEAGRYGFKIMRERAEAVDARLEIESAPGRGTRITAILERTA